MIQITNKKVKGFKTVWAPFKGFSLVFDNPGKSFAPMENFSMLEKINCLHGERELNFYQGLWSQTTYYEDMLHSCLFCPLPSHSYHVTVWDGLNDFNFDQVSEEYRLELKQFLQRLPNSLQTNSPFLVTGNGQPIRASFDGRISFEFGQLHVSQALTVTLRPADSESEQILHEIEEQRNVLLKDFVQRFGITTANLTYRPHVSLGYFANPELVEHATTTIEHLNNVLLKDMAGQTITFDSMSLYGMTDMETFYRSII